MNRKRPRQLGKKHQGLHGEKPRAPRLESGFQDPYRPALPKGAEKSTGKPAGKPTGKPPSNSWGSGKPASQSSPKSGPKSGSSGKAFRDPKGAGRPPGSHEGKRPGAFNRPEGQEQKPRFAPPSRSARPTLSKSTPRSTTPRPGALGARQVWGHTAPPSRARLEELLRTHGVTLPPGVLDKVWQYHGILRRNNGDLDLTRLIGFETIVQRHYADCLILHKMMNGKWPSPLVDIGTGAGFPGLMIKIASPATEMILSEPRNVRVDYLNNTIAELGLKNISVFGHKFTSRSFSTPVNGAITRAFEPIQKTLLRLENSLQVGGLAMFMKGPGVDEELSHPIPSNYKLVRDERYRIPATTLDRAFVVLERIA